jgi:hypothetical protein
MTGLQLITKEREEQIKKHRYTPEVDKQNNKFRELAKAAQVLISNEYLDKRQALMAMPSEWDNEACLKMVSKTYKERLIIAGAFIAAEIDRVK